MAVKRRVRSDGVVEADPACQPGTQRRACLKGVDVHALIFQGSPQQLDENIVHPAAAAVHADAHAGGLQASGETGAGELTPLVCVEDFQRPEFHQGLRQCLNAKIDLDRVGKPPGQNTARCPIHDCHQIQKAAAHRQIRNISTPKLVGAA